MEARAWNVVYVVVGLLGLLVSVPALLHHHYEYFDSFDEGWVPYIAFVLFGGCLFLYGLIGLVRAKRRNGSYQ
jgi:hypothetical protein